ncbi:MAG TPA: ABC-F family ATP-binding cassette domain-containing protein [Candidatus Limnocylindria bacterium]|nr:ABC-F family ATP-binding cassette domain-containing protein [Candidatus Limnocylindria bacterium]
MARINLVNLESVSKTFGTRTLLDAVSLGVSEGDRIGVVGRNGDGKTTLVSVLAGIEPADTGRVTRTGGLTVGVLAQDDVLDPGASVRDVVVKTRPDHVWRGEARIRGAVSALLGDVPLDASIGRLSGGERRRVALAALVVDDPDLLVLDEPTNHLDVEAVAWLADHLASRRGALVVVTHDRWFLDAVATRTWDVVDGRVHEYDGGYAAYVLARAERERVAAADESRRQNLLRKELAWLRRGPPARTSKPRFRIDAANALIADEPPARDSVELVRFAATRLGKSVYDVEDATMAVGDRVLLDHLTWRLGPGDRVGVVGVNGSGKSSLLRLLAGELVPVDGRVRTGKTVRPAFLTQEVAEIDEDQRVLESVESVRRTVDLGGGQTLTAASLVERMGFRAEKAWTRVGDLSGGERRRLQLVRLLMDEPNVLLLDEPSNDLDIETLTALEDLLDGFAGTVVLVSHDRYVLERVCDRVVGLLGDGTLRDLPGGVEEYLALRARASMAARVEPTPEPDEGSAASGPSTAAVRAARKELTRIQRRLDRLGAEEDALHAELADAASDHERVLPLDVRLRALLAERAVLEEEWLGLAERLEDAIP